MNGMVSDQLDFKGACQFHGFEWFVLALLNILIHMQVQRYMKFLSQLRCLGEVLQKLHAGMGSDLKAGARVGINQLFFDTPDFIMIWLGDPIGIDKP
jgi:hypothetical protein